MRNSKRQSPPTVRFLPKSRATKWLFLGDSITLGARHTHGRRDYTKMFSERVRYELRRPKDLILNAAVDSATAQDCLAGLDYILASFQPDITFLMIGMNDAAADRRIPIPQFKATLLAIVAKLRHAVTTVTGSADYAKFLEGQGIDKEPLALDTYVNFGPQETLRWAEIVRISGAKLD